MLASCFTWASGRLSHLTDWPDGWLPARRAAAHAPRQPAACAALVPRRRCWPAALVPNSSASPPPRAATAARA